MQQTGTKSSAGKGQTKALLSGAPSKEQIINNAIADHPPLGAVGGIHKRAFLSWNLLTEYTQNEVFGKKTQYVNCDLLITFFVGKTHLWVSRKHCVHGLISCLNDEALFLKVFVPFCFYSPVFEGKKTEKIFFKGKKKIK